MKKVKPIEKRIIQGIQFPYTIPAHKSQSREKRLVKAIDEGRELGK
jgi:hypothetical protein